MATNPFNLENKVILVTGASSGIGRAIAIECSKAGAQLYITGRNEERLNETLKGLTGENNVAIKADLTDSDNIKELCAALPELDGLVLSAGVVEISPILFAKNEKFKKIYETNLFAPIELVRTIVKKKRCKPGASVVGIASTAGNSDFCPGNAIYGSGKAAFASFFKYCALELASRNIRCNTVSPGMILTPMHSLSSIGEDQIKEMVQQIPMKRWGLPEEVAFAVIYLLSDASAYVTGADIKIDGGQTI